MRIAVLTALRTTPSARSGNVAHISAVIGQAGADNVAAVLMEPNAGTNGIIAPDNFWPALRAQTQQRGVYLIADEVMSGFGRCGEWFAWQAFGEAGRPDLMTLAKGLTGAHIPLGAVVLAKHVAAKLEHSMLNTGLTYCGHPLACATGVAAIEAYRDERLIERSRVLGALMLRRLRAMQQRHAVIGDVRGAKGLFAIVELVKNRETREPLAPWPAVHPSMVRLVAAARDRGVSFAIRGNLIILAPPLVIGENELESALDIMDSLLGELSGHEKAKHQNRFAGSQGSRAAGPRCARRLAVLSARLSLRHVARQGGGSLDVDGNRFLDFAAGIAVCSTGHSHPAVVQAIKDAADKFLHISSDYWHEGQVRLAERLNELSPMKERS